MLGPRTIGRSLFGVTIRVAGAFDADALLGIADVAVRAVDRVFARRPALPDPKRAALLGTTVVVVEALDAKAPELFRAVPIARALLIRLATIAVPELGVTPARPRRASEAAGTPGMGTAAFGARACHRARFARAAARRAHGAARRRVAGRVAAGRRYVAGADARAASDGWGSGVCGQQLNRLRVASDDDERTECQERTSSAKATTGEHGAGSLPHAGARREREQP